MNPGGHTFVLDILSYILQFTNGWTQTNKHVIRRETLINTKIIVPPLISQILRDFKQKQVYNTE